MDTSSLFDVWKIRANHYRGAYAWDRFYERFFDGVDLADKEILDIGGGVGLASTYAIVKGASKAVLLEPESDGSSANMLDRAHALAQDLGCESRVVALNSTFQDFVAGSRMFDIIVLEASINHLNEHAVQRLDFDSEAEDEYLLLVAKMYEMLRPGGVVILSDCGKRNFFGDFGLKNPFTPTIEWQKHQQPRTWADLFSKMNFSRLSLKWGVHASLGKIGQIFLGNRVVFYFISSYFILTMSKSN